jgi:hypothetical protein
MGKSGVVRNDNLQTIRLDHPFCEYLQPNQDLKLKSFLHSNNKTRLVDSLPFTSQSAIYRAPVLPEASKMLSTRSLYDIVNSHKAIIVESNRLTVAACSTGHEQIRMDWRKAADAVQFACPIGSETDLSSHICYTSALLTSADHFLRSSNISWTCPFTALLPSEIDFTISAPVLSLYPSSARHNEKYRSRFPCCRPRQTSRPTFSKIASFHV